MAHLIAFCQLNDIQEQLPCRHCSTIQHSSNQIVEPSGLSALLTAGSHLFFLLNTRKKTVFSPLRQFYALLQMPLKPA
jgi:hypothetical protein